MDLKYLIAFTGVANIVFGGCEYCLGPDNYGVNAPVNPVTCDGDVFIDVAAFYWKAHQDGLEYAIDNHVTNPFEGSGVVGDLGDLNNLIDAQYKSPDFKGDFGFKLGIGYASACDGWDFGVLWTWYQGKANSHLEAEFDDNHSLIPLWSAFQSVTGTSLVANDIRTNWKLKLNLADLELGRMFWTSHLLSIRPFVGLRIAYIDQKFEIQQNGSSYGDIINTFPLVFQSAVKNFIELKNEFHGAGLRSGLGSTWNLGCGWTLYGDFAASLVYGTFNVDHDESNRLATTPHTKTKVLDSSECFHTSRAMLDLGLGLQWSTIFCDCKYALSAALGWEQHLFFHQNQLWRVMRSGGEIAAFLPNPSGENVFKQSRGTLDTQGVTLALKFKF